MTRFARLMKASVRHINTILFVAGFVFDLLILPEAGHVATIIIGAVYLCIVGTAIALREILISRNTASATERKLFSFLTFVIAYFSGSSLSFICVYALRSAILSVSWPLIVILFLCVLANEVVSSHYFRLTLDIGVFLTALFFFIVFNAPTVMKVQNDTTFLISTIIAIVISLCYVRILSYTSESAEEEASRSYALAFGIPMFIGMLYFLNVIPAVPLVLSKAGAYHMVIRNDDGTFVGTSEVDNRFFASLRSPQYHLQDSDKGVYFFSSVSAPAELTAPLSHVWEYYDVATKTWKEVARIEFTLAGGRQDGYRAYSHKENVTEGLWRVTVKVDDKRVVGRVKFKIVKDNVVSTFTTDKL